VAVLLHRIRTVWEPAKAAGDQVKAPAGVRAKAEVQVRAKEGGLEKSKYFLKIGN
jgi:hypothetical protein